MLEKGSLVNGLQLARWKADEGLSAYDSLPFLTLLSRLTRLHADCRNRLSHQLSRLKAVPIDEPPTSCRIQICWTSEYEDRTLCRTTSPTVPLSLLSSSRVNIRPGLARRCAGTPISVRSVADACSPARPLLPLPSRCDRLTCRIA